MKVDLEFILDKIVAILQSNLDAKIDEIEAEKAAAGKALATPLDKISTDAYFLQSWNDAILNYHPAIFYGIDDTPTIRGPVTGLSPTIFIDVVYQDDGNRDNDTWRRINRYTRAIKEIIEKNQGKIPGCAYLEVNAVRPESFRLALDSSEEIKVGGVSVRTAFG